MNPKKSIYLVPLGGLGNRYRVISTGINSGSVLTLISVRSKFFPVHLSEVFDLKELNIKEIRLPGTWPDRLTTAVSRSFGLLPFTPSYGVREITTSGIYASPHAFDYPWHKIDLIKRSHNLFLLGRYNAIHLRGTDNIRAVSANNLEDFFDFVEQSELPVYVASDSDETKHLFSQKFKDKVVISSLDLTRSGKESFYQAVDEMSVLVEANHFMGSQFSSFSRLVLELRSL